MNKQNPFADSVLERIFTPHSKFENRTSTRESSTIEFKANFHMGDSLRQYGRTMAAYSNTMGGYIIYGIENSPRNMTGMTNKTFVDFDPARFTEFLNSKFAPEIRWDTFIYYIGDNEFGIIYTYESLNKPVIATANGGNIFYEGEIYYRYRGRTQKIKYPEIRQIINDVRENDQKLWLKHLSRISKIGPENAAIFNPFNGTIEGKSGSFFLDEDLLEKVQFIREGEFREITGYPTLKVIGNAEILATGEIISERTIVREKGIHEIDIINNFLSLQKVESPLDYILEICFLNSAYLPIYYYMKAADFTIKQIIEEIKIIENCNNSSRSRLLDRLLKGDNRIHFTIPDNSTESTKIKHLYRKQLINKEEIDINSEINLRHILHSVQTLAKKEVDIDFVFGMIKHWYKKFWSTITITKTEFRKAICHLDYVLFFKDFK